MTPLIVLFLTKIFHLLTCEPAPEVSRKRTYGFWLKKFESVCS